MTNKISWDELKKILMVGEEITATILRHEPYGVFVNIGYDYDGLIQITDFKENGVMTQKEYPGIGEEIQTVVLGFKDHGQQVWLKKK